MYLPGNNGTQTRGARTIKRHFWGAMKKLLGKSSCKASLRGRHCSLGGLHDPPVCSHADDAAEPAFGLSLHKVFLALTVSGTFPYAERKRGVIRSAPSFCLCARVQLTLKPAAPICDDLTTCEHFQHFRCNY